MSQDVHFAFGANWKRFLRHVTDERIDHAGRSLADFMAMGSFQGRSFLDVGCGSGLFSYAAFKLGASRVVSFDTDPLSVECCKFLHGKAGGAAHWSVHNASILDSEFVSKLGGFDIVYAWGTLQHTGRMWEALRRAMQLVNPGGYLYIAIYNRVDGWMGSSFWLGIKRFFNAMPRPVQWLMEMLSVPAFFAARLLRARSLISAAKGYESLRGMYWRTDITDWIGGLPYECATVEEVFRFVTVNGNGFNLRNLRTTNSLANNWYLFQRVKK